MLTLKFCSSLRESGSLATANEILEPYGVALPLHSLLLFGTPGAFSALGLTLLPGFFSILVKYIFYFSI